VRAITLVAVAALATVGVAAAGPAARGPFPLAVLPNLGAVSWSCTAAASSPGLRHRLSFHADPTAATDRLVLRIAAVAVSHRTVQPGHTVRLPWTRATRMSLDVVQMTEARTIAARVDVDFTHPARASGACLRYFPPEVEVRLRYR
jgi:hypothetical protein